MKKTTLVGIAVVVVVIALVWMRREQTPEPEGGSRLAAARAEPEGAAPSAPSGEASAPVGHAPSLSKSEAGQPGRSPYSAAAMARVTVGDRQYALRSDPEGLFGPRVYTDIGARAAVAVTFPDGEPGEPVVVQVEDGGALENSELTKLAQLDERRQVGFEFQMTKNPGLFRVVLRKGAERKTVEFWAGPPLPVAKN